VTNLFLRVTATDVGNKSTFSEFTLSVPNPGIANDAPEVRTGKSYADVAWDGNGLKQSLISGTVFSDPDGDLLTLSVSMANGSAFPSWLSFDATTRVLSGNPPPSFNGQTLALSVTARDPFNASVSSPLNLVITNANDVPMINTGVVSQLMSGSGDKSFALPADVFADADGESLTLSATQFGGTPLPAWLSFNASTRTFSGNPPAGTAALNILLTATDSQASIATTSFKLSFADTNDAPVMTQAPVGSYFLKVGEPISIDFSSSFDDVDLAYGDSLIFSALTSSGHPLPAWLNFDPVTARLTGIPSAADVDLQKILLTATDKRGLQAVITIDLQVLPVPPVETNVAPTAITVTDNVVETNIPLPQFFLSPTIAPPEASLHVDSSQFVPPAPESGGFRMAPLSSSPPNFDSPAVTRADGFQIEVLRSTSISAGTGLVLMRPMTDQAVDSGSNIIEITIPRGIFAHTRDDVTVSLTASQADGSALPSWLRFDPVKGVFLGTAPEGMKGVIEIRLVARDSLGNRVETTFRISVGDKDKSAIRSKISLSAQLAEARLGLRPGSHDPLFAHLRTPVQADSHSPRGPSRS
jgi:hypothetical protein